MKEKDGDVVHTMVSTSLTYLPFLFKKKITTDCSRSEKLTDSRLCTNLYIYQYEQWPRARTRSLSNQVEERDALERPGYGTTSQMPVQPHFEVRSWGEPNYQSSQNSCCPASALHCTASSQKRSMPPGHRASGLLSRNRDRPRLGAYLQRRA